MQGYFWCVDQCGFATDIMFQERSFLEDIYPSLVGHAFHDLSCTDVFTFMGRKPNPRFQGEAVSDYKKTSHWLQGEVQVEVQQCQGMTNAACSGYKQPSTTRVSLKYSALSATRTAPNQNSGNPWGNPSQTCTVTPKSQKPAT